MLYCQKLSTPLPGILIKALIFREIFSSLWSVHRHLGGCWWRRKSRGVPTLINNMFFDDETENVCFDVAFLWLLYFATVETWNWRWGGMWKMENSLRIYFQVFFFYLYLIITKVCFFFWVVYTTAYVHVNVFLSFFFIFLCRG